MKKCPYCHADIEDNARFCVFCMSSLQEKQKIENEITNNKRWPYIIAAFLLLVLVFGISIFALSKNKANSNTHNDATQSQILSTYSSMHENTVTSNDEINFNNSITNSSNTENTNSNSNGNNTSSNNIPDNSTHHTPDFNNSQDNTVTNSSSSLPSTPSQSEPQQSDDSSSSILEQQPPVELPIEPTSATYLYRDAVATDCYTEGNIPAQPIEDVIVITGVASAASDGVYNIPETIDGKKVGGIMPSAFCDPNISSTVKKVVVPASVKTIWQNAFADCYNLTDIYLCGKIINIFENSFADLSKRNATLTIHCSHDCKTFGFYYYRNIANNYSAVYQEWNGGEIQ